jgi:hypothetical protein
MTFRTAALAVALAAAGCGSGVHDITVAATPLRVLHGHVDLTALVRPNPAAPLLGAMLWATVPGVNPVCVELADQKLTPNDPTQAQEVLTACPDPSGVFPGPPQVWVPIDADGNFDLALYTLPAITVSVGDSVTRIAYGTLIAVEDADGDGQPTLPQPSPITEGRRRGFGVQLFSPDRIVAATFYDLKANQQRIVFREGGFTTPSFFYPAPGPGPGCEPPTDGFWIMNAPPYADPPVGDCTFSSTDTRLELTPLSQADGLAFLCRGIQVDDTVRQPVDDEGPPPGATNVCFGSNVMAAVANAGTCAQMRSWALSGCQEDPLCGTPEWTIAASTISWWPCP